MLLRFVKSLRASRGEIRGARGVAVGLSCKAPEAITTGGGSRAQVRASQRAAPFILQTRSVCASLVGVLQKCTAAVWRANWARARSALFRSFGLPKFLAEIFGRNQQPDDDGTNDGFGADLLPGKTQVIIGDVSQR